MSKLLIWHCLNRISALKRFGKALEAYISHSQVHNMISIPKDAEGEEARERVNRLLPKVSKFVRESGCSTSIVYTPPPIVGGPILPNVDLLTNIFQLSRFDVSYYAIFDFVQRAIGYYNDEAPKALIRTLNPFWWLAQIVAFLISVPIRILAWAGYGQIEKLEASQGGRLYRAAAGLVAFALGLIALLANLAQIMSLILQVLERLGF